MNNCIVDATVENFRARLVELGLPQPEWPGVIPPYISDRIRALAEGKLLIVRELTTSFGAAHVIQVAGDPAPLYFLPFK